MLVVVPIPHKQLVQKTSLLLGLLSMLWLWVFFFVPDALTDQIASGANQPQNSAELISKIIRSSNLLDPEAALYSPFSPPWVLSVQTKSLAGWFHVGVIAVPLCSSEWPCSRSLVPRHVCPALMLLWLLPCRPAVCQGRCHPARYTLRWQNLLFLSGGQPRQEPRGTITGLQSGTAV